MIVGFVLYIVILLLTSSKALIFAVKTWLQVNLPGPTYIAAFFSHAASHQLQLADQTQQSATQLRSAVVDFLRQNRQIQGPDGEVDYGTVNDDWPGYLNNMGKDGTWADAHILLLWQYAMHWHLGNYKFTWTKHEWQLTLNCGEKDFRDTTIMLGHEWEQHYMNIAPLSAILQVSLMTPAPSTPLSPVQSSPRITTPPAPSLLISGTTPSIDHGSQQKVSKLSCGDFT